MAWTQHTLWPTDSLRTSWTRTGCRGQKENRPHKLLTWSLLLCPLHASLTPQKTFSLESRQTCGWKTLKINPLFAVSGKEDGTGKPMTQNTKGRNEKRRDGKGRMGEKAEPTVRGKKVQQKRIRQRGGEKVVCYPAATNEFLESRNLYHRKYKVMKRTSLKVSSSPHIACNYFLLFLFFSRRGRENQAHCTILRDRCLGAAIQHIQQEWPTASEHSSAVQQLHIVLKMNRNRQNRFCVILISTYINISSR